MSASPQAVVSVVIPAHDEALVIGRCLASLAVQPLAASCEVVVVANGCSDDTVAVARTYADRLPLLQVLDLPASGKVGALNAGDDVASAFPRVYLDADVELSPDALSPLVEALDVPVARVAAPGIRFDTSGADPVVQAFYAANRALPYVTDGLVGLGLYGLSRAGRERFAAFPDLTADDLFVQRCFAEEERTTTAGTFTVRVPRDTRSLLRVRRRTNQGNAELARRLAEDPELSATGSFERSSGGTMAALVRLALSRPSLILPAIVYVVIGLLSRLPSRSGADVWLRDESSRRA